MTCSVQQARNNAILKTVKVMPARAEWIAAEATQETLYIRRCFGQWCVLSCSVFPLLFAVQSSCAAQLIWRGFQRRTLGFAADKVTRYVAFLSGRCCLWEWSICRTGHLRRWEHRQVFLLQKRAAVRQNCLIQQLFFCVVIPALPAAPARSRCSGTCRWSSAQRSGRTLPQWRRCSGGCGILQCSQGAWGASAFPCARPCRFQ